MKIKFCGAAQFVTGSCHLVTLDNGYKILLDCGLFQGKGKDVWDWNVHWHFEPKEIDCLVLSHAHIDHTGRVPKLVKDGYEGNIYCTHATRSLCSIMLLDSAYIQERDVEDYNRKLKEKEKSRKKPRVPLYTSKVIPKTMSQFVSVGTERWIPIGPGVELLFREAGHILGSASVTLKITENGRETILGFTGDIGRPDRPILRDPEPMIPADYLICESTYGDRLHETKPDQEHKLLDIIREICVKRRGKLIIPAFSVGRTQEIVYMLDQMANKDWLPRLPIYVDSPLAVNATNVFIQHPECYDDSLLDYMSRDSDPFGFNGLTYIKQVVDSKALNDNNDPCVIISAAGMMNAGRVKHHLFNNMEKKNCGILIVGYCSPGTPGGDLLEGKRELTLFGQTKQVHAEVFRMESFSAHGDQKEMTDFISNQKGAEHIFLVHGEPETQINFKTHLEGEGFKEIHIPEKGQEYTLNTSNEE
jgi:metallo-beta-lactamase family protein